MSSYIWKNIHKCTSDQRFHLANKNNSNNNNNNNNNEPRGNQKERGKVCVVSYCHSPRGASCTGDVTETASMTASLGMVNTNLLTCRHRFLRSVINPTLHCLQSPACCFQFTLRLQGLLRQSPSRGTSRRSVPVLASNYRSHSYSAVYTRGHLAVCGYRPLNDDAGSPVQFRSGRLTA